MDLYINLFETSDDEREVKHKHGRPNYYRRKARIVIKEFNGSVRSIKSLIKAIPYDANDRNKHLYISIVRATDEEFNTIYNKISGPNNMEIKRYVAGEYIDVYD